MSILSLLAKLTMDKTGFDAAMASANKAVGQFGAHLASTLKSQVAGAFAVGAMVAFARETVAYGDSIQELGERLGVTSHEAQQFAIAAKLGGADMEFFATKFDKLKKAMSEAIGGGKNPLAAFGLSVEQLSQMRPAEVIKVLSDQISAVGVSADQAVKFVEIFGKGGAKMINILGDLQNANKGTLFFSDADLKRMHDADDEIIKFGNNAKVALAIALRTATALAQMAQIKFGRIPDFLKGGAGKAAVSIPENQILTDMESAEEAAKVHMAVMERVAALDRDAAKLEADVHKAGMTDAERKNELLKERVTLMENLRTMVGDMPAAEEEARAMMRKRLAEVNLDINRIDQQKPKTAVRALAQIENTKLGAIGGTLGTSGTRSEQTQSETLRQIKELREDMIRRGILVKSWR